MLAPSIHKSVHTAVTGSYKIFEIIFVTVLSTIDSRLHPFLHVRNYVYFISYYLLYRSSNQRYIDLKREERIKVMRNE